MIQQYINLNLAREKESANESMNVSVVIMQVLYLLRQYPLSSRHWDLLPPFGLPFDSIEHTSLVGSLQVAHTPHEPAIVMSASLSNSIKEFLFTHPSVLFLTLEYTGIPIDPSCIVPSSPSSSP